MKSFNYVYTHQSDNAPLCGPTAPSVFGLPYIIYQLHITTLTPSCGQKGDKIDCLFVSQMFQMIPQQSKAVAKFTNPQHAASFQMSFHRYLMLVTLYICM